MPTTTFITAIAIAVLASPFALAVGNGTRTPTRSTITPSTAQTPSPSATPSVQKTATPTVPKSATSSLLKTATTSAPNTATQSVPTSATHSVPNTASASIPATKSAAPTPTVAVSKSHTTVIDPTAPNHTFAVNGDDQDRYYLLRTDLVLDVGAAAPADGSATYDCATPPSLESMKGRRSAVHTGSPSAVTVDLAPLGPGAYFVCRKGVNDTAAGYRGFAPEPWNVTIAAPTLTCPASTICQAIPATLSNLKSGAQEVQFVGLADVGTDIRLVNMYVNGQKDFSCTSLPTDPASYTAVQTHAGGAPTLSFDVENKNPGEYTLCRRPPAGSWGELALSVTVSGAVDTMHSSLSCCAGPHTVGERVYCQIHARDAMDAPAGTADQSCKFSVSQVKDGAGAVLPRSLISAPYFLETGLFEFYYIPEKSGCKASSGVAYGGSVLQNKIQLYSLEPRDPMEAKFTADCGVMTGTVKCNVTKRDEYSNPISSCNTMADGTIVCS